MDRRRFESRAARDFLSYAVRVRSLTLSNNPPESAHGRAE